MTTPSHPAIILLPGTDLLWADLLRADSLEPRIEAAPDVDDNGIQVARQEIHGEAVELRPFRITATRQKSSVRVNVFRKVA